MCFLTATDKEKIKINLANDVTTSSLRSTNRDYGVLIFNVVQGSISFSETNVLIINIVCDLGFGVISSGGKYILRLVVIFNVTLTCPAESRTLQHQSANVSLQSEISILDSNVYVVLCCHLSRPIEQLGVFCFFNIDSCSCDFSFTKNV